MKRLAPNGWLSRFLLADLVLFGGLSTGAAVFAQPARFPETSVSASPGEEDPQQARVSEEKSGTLSLREGGRVRVVTDLGNVRIQTQNSGQVNYKVRIETSRSEPDAEKWVRQFLVTARTTPEGVHITGQAPWERFRGRLWVNYELNVPRGAHLDIQTQAGNIETEDVDGRVWMVTAGGNIQAGRLGSPEESGEKPGGRSYAAQLETAGGHIAVRDVFGDLTANTGGGHISAGNVKGSAVLRSGGGHIRLGSVGGQAQLDTGGGNIVVQRSASKVVATTGGGRIDFGEVSGGIRARTAGGGIRVMQVSGPTQLETGGGSIYLTRVQGAVNASTAAGNITAWFLPLEKRRGGASAEKPAKSSELVCTLGDIVVYLPRELPITIDASIEMSGDHRIDADPAIPLKIVHPPAGSGGPHGMSTVRAEAALNGGGQLLRLRTVAGSIRLRFAEAAQELQRHLEKGRAYELERQERELERALELRARELERQAREQEGQARKHQREAERDLSRVEQWRYKIWEFFSGRVQVDAGVLKNKLIHKVSPEYPEAARKQRVEGVVELEVVVGKDGKVEDVKVVSGHLALVQAAQDAVRQWRYDPLIAGGKPVVVVATVKVEFRLER